MPYCALFILGREGVGKTSLLKRLIQKPFLKDFDWTTGEVVEASDPVGTLEWKLTDDDNRAGPAAYAKIPSVVFNFNVFDLAGGDVYRPVHQHFMSHSGLFMLVFKLPDMLQYINDPDGAQYNPLDDLFFWVVSLHRHVQPDTEEVKKVLLVGTHREELPRVSENLQTINRFIRQNFLCGKDAPLRKHIHNIDQEFFIPVDNSMNETKTVQDQLIAMCKHLPNTAKPYPIVWQNFEEKLKLLQKQCPIIKKDEAWKLSKQSGVSDWDQYKEAMQFFHYTGRIMCLGELRSN